MRNGPLDAYRGIAVGGMALVNLEDPFREGLPWLEHARWDGMTFADLVFPFFIVGVGLSTSLAVDAPRTLSWTKLVRRSLSLVLLGVFLNWLLHPRPDFWNIRASGVLQRIGVVYFLCAAVAKSSSKPWAPLAGAVILLAAHGAALLFIPAPGEAKAVLTQGLGLSGWLDRHLLPGRMVRDGYDPEGVLSTTSAIATGLIGLFAMRWARASAPEGPGPAKVYAGFAAVLCLAGLFAVLMFPLNKQLWTPSFALLTAGLGLLLLAALEGQWPRIKAWWLSQGCAYLGRYALTFYVVHMVIIAGLMLKGPGGRFWDVLVSVISAPGLAIPLASLVLACALTVVSILAVRGLVRINWVIRL